MARKSISIKSARLRRAKYAAVKAGRKMKFSTKVYNRCQICDRPRGYINDFAMCRICIRELANKGEIPGLKKSSW